MYFYNSEVKCLPYLITNCNVPSNATEPLCTQNYVVQLHSCFYHDTKEEKKNFPSLSPHPMVRTLLDCANEIFTEQVGRICMSESLTCPISKSMTLACDAASVSMDFSQAQVEEKNKLHPQKVGSNSLSPKSKVKGKGKTVLDSCPSWCIVDFFFF